MIEYAAIAMSVLENKFMLIKISFKVPWMGSNILFLEGWIGENPVISMVLRFFSTHLALYQQT